jgi:hypothetical protein
MFPPTPQNALLRLTINAVFNQWSDPMANKMNHRHGGGRRNEGKSEVDLRFLLRPEPLALDQITEGLDDAFIDSEMFDTGCCAECEDMARRYSTDNNEG